PARSQRGRQVDADPLHDRAGAGHLGPDRGLRLRRDFRLRRCPSGRRLGAAGGQPGLVPDRRGDARLPRRLLRDAEAGPPWPPRALLGARPLAEKRGERPRTLSGGMKRRVVPARAMMHRPRLLILDEPTAGVDVELRLELWHYVQKINEEGTTILLTTHYIEE